MLKLIKSPVILAVTRHGGHIAFLEGFWPTSANLLDRAVPQFVSAVFEHLDELSAAVAWPNVKDDLKVANGLDVNREMEALLP